MQLDEHRIAIRERGYLEVLDLALRVIAGYAGPLAVALLVGILPFALLNAWLLPHVVPPVLESEVPEDAPQVVQLLWNAPKGYLWWMLVFAVWEMPLATAPATLLLGQSLFSERLEAGRVWRSFLAALPQLLVYQVLLRGLLVLPGLLILPVFLWFIPFSFWAYLNEIILLERNPMRAGRSRGVTTGTRKTALHAGMAGDLFGRWLLSMLTGTLLFASLFASLWILGGILFNSWTAEVLTFTVYWPAAMWTVIALFAVVRFLGYLDLRIRREGWEVELLMRAEEARLVRQWT